MRSLEKGKDKVQKICDMLRRETLEPAQLEAESLLLEAKQRADAIREEAEQHAKQLIQQAKAQIEQERNIFHSALQQAVKQTIEILKQEIENKFFNENLSLILEQQLSDPKLIAKLINSIVEAIDREGLNTELTAVVAKNISVKDVNALLIENVRNRLKGNPLEIGNFEGGVQVKLHGKKMTLDISDQVLKEIVVRYMRKDFRAFIFSSG
jgi:V/A-type H+-transporting ATPase subunit E